MFFIVVIVILLYLLFLVYMTKPIVSYSMASAAALGDSFGIINTLFSGLAFAGLLITILLQREELKESREMFKSQRFEDSFYRLLDFYRNNLSEISITVDNDKITGIASLSHQLRRFQQSTKSLNIPTINDNETDKIFERIDNTLTHQSRYLGTLESLLSLVMMDAPHSVDKVFYIKLISSQLTIHEIKYIFYRCLSLDTDTELVKLMENSKLLHLRIRESDISDKYIDLYNNKHGSCL
ncbi:putative phage abortive infection protein [Aeromonas caviae]